MTGLLRPSNTTRIALGGAAATLGARYAPAWALCPLRTQRLAANTSLLPPRLGTLCPLPSDPPTPLDPDDLRAPGLSLAFFGVVAVKVLLFVAGEAHSPHTVSWGPAGLPSGGGLKSGSGRGHSLSRDR